MPVKHTEIGPILNASKLSKRINKCMKVVLHTRFTSLIKTKLEEIRSTSPCITVCHVRSDDRFIEVKYNLKRKNLHEENEEKE